MRFMFRMSGRTRSGRRGNYDARGGLCFLTTGGMGTMGYALPAAIGARLAAPGRQVVAVCGDGAFQMEMMELATANQHGVTVKLVVMNNQMLGMVREIQHDGYGGRETAVALGGGPGCQRSPRHTRFDISALTR